MVWSLFRRHYGARPISAATLARVLPTLIFFSQQNRTSTTKIHGNSRCSVRVELNFLFFTCSRLPSRNHIDGVRQVFAPTKGNGPTSAEIRLRHEATGFR